VIEKEELISRLNEMVALPAETEWLEFKEAKDNFDFNELGRYFSALSNEANLKGRRYGWLVFGVRDKPREIIGTRFREKRADLDHLKSEVADRITDHISFIEIYELLLPVGRVIMFQIPAAPQGIPIAWKGHYYGRTSESIGPLNIQEIEQIRSQLKDYDWSAQICSKATIEDLDPEAIKRARIEYKNKNQNQQLAQEVDAWDDITFLNKAKLTIKGKITRAAIILLGREESDHFISPAVARISWILHDDKGASKDYQHYGPPFLLNSEAVNNKIRNLTYRYLQDNTLFPTELKQYEPYLIRETLHNCIAHQDYELKGKINVIEKPDELLFTNVGRFLPGSLDKVIAENAPPERYRNHFLANAMVSLNMIDTVGSGIRKMFGLQIKRYFPLPDYDLGEPERVKVRILGKIVNENYTRLLIKRPDLDFKTVMDLDKVQKGFPIDDVDVRKLRSQGLVEGRKPNYYVSAKVAAITDNRSGYIKNRAFDDDYYKDLVISYLNKYKSASRKDLVNLLQDKLSDALEPKQKANKIKNLIFAMSGKDKTIVNQGNNRNPIWVLNENNPNQS
jgi:ATP-dependent DNA helicase RecG